MRHVLAIARRELRSYFVSPIAYAAITAYLILSGYFFNSMLVYYVTQASRADRQITALGRSELQLDVPTVVIEEYFKQQLFILLLIVPLLTMGLISDERRKGTLELLLTSPVRPLELTLGKFFGSVALIAVMCVPTMAYWYFLAQGGQWEPGVIVAGYLGVLLLACTQVAIGLFISSLTENMLVSALATYAVLVVLNFIDTSASVARSIWADFIQFLSFYYHNAEFARGVVALGDVVYYLSFLTLALFLTQRSIEATRYRRD